MDDFGNVHRICDHDYGASGSCSFSETSATQLFTKSTYASITETTSGGSTDYNSFPSSIEIIPDSQGIFAYTVLLPTRNGIGWVGVKTTTSYYALYDFAAGAPHNRYIDALVVVYDAGRQIVYLGEYSYGPPTAWTNTGIYLGEFGPNPGYHASSTALSIRPGPYAQLSTYTTPGTVIAGTALNVTIVAKDYLGAVWSANSPRNFDFKAFGTAKSGAALTFTGNVAQTDSSSGTYRGWTIFEEAGTYTVRVTEGPGKQKLKSIQGSQADQSVVVKAAATAARQSELVLESRCVPLVAGTR